MLIVENLYKSYSQKEVLKGLTFELKKGNIYGIVGENGSGKTTLFECIRGFHTYTGNISLNKTAKIGFLPATLYFYPLMKGREYIEFCLAARKQKVNTEKYDLLRELFDLPLNEYAQEYSTGMQKKLALMVLLLQENDFLLLDEAFNGLDLETVLIVKELIKKWTDNNKVIFLSSHIINILTDICDTILFLHKGKIFESFSKENFNEIEKRIVDNNINEKISKIQRLFSHPK